MTQMANPKKALVVVLGELARSPRMQYHCNSLASNHYQVSVIANKGGTCEELDQNPNIKQCLMDEPPNFRKYLPSILAYFLKPIWQSFQLIYHLIFTLSLVHVIILQNPPSIPTLPIFYLYNRLTGSKLIIDWHNYGYSILGLSLEATHPIVRISKWIELFFGRLADAGFCVSKSMREDLENNHGIIYPLHVLYDKPPKHFKPLSLRERHKFFLKMKSEFREFRSPSEDVFDPNEVPSIVSCETRFTISDRSNKNVIHPRLDKPAIIMSSTSWTEDEDFGLLLDALRYYDLAKSTKTLDHDLIDIEEELKLPNLVCVITGKGPLKSYFENQIKQCKFEHIQVILPWLSSSDYSKMVASCDIGISLHSSSSKVDLPMKVVDMFGCGLPVLAYDYKAISELVIEGFYGLTFTDSADLFSKMVLLLKQNSLLDDFKKNIKRRFLLSRWEDNWDRKAKPVFDELCSLSARNKIKNHTTVDSKGNKSE